VEQEPLFQVFVDVRKAHDHLNQLKCLEIMTGYGVGPKLLCLQPKFWDQAQMVCHAGGSFGKPFAVFWGITQGGPLSSFVINVCVDAVIREWLCRMIEVEAIGGVFSEACKEIIAFLVDKLVGLKNHVWLQSAMDILVTLFGGMGLRTNPDKTKVMTCIPGNIQEAHNKEVYQHVQQQGPVNPTVKRHQVECDVCGASLAAGSLQGHLETQHDTYWLFVLNQELTIECEPWIH
jgi:hypothetical protein